VGVFTTAQVEQLSWSHRIAWVGMDL